MCLLYNKYAFVHVVKTALDLVDDEITKIKVTIRFSCFLLGRSK